LAGGREARAMAGAVPALLETVPAHQASQVGADRRALVQHSGFVPTGGHELRSASHHRPRSGSDLIDIFGIASRDVVAELGGDVEVLPHRLEWGGEAGAAGCV